jgi:hypothetical protein
MDLSFPTKDHFPTAATFEALLAACDLLNQDRFEQGLQALEALSASLAVCEGDNFIA